MELEAGQRLRVTADLPGDPSPLPIGMEGTVKRVSTIGDCSQVFVDWEGSRSLILVVPPDDACVEVVS